MACNDEDILDSQIIAENVSFLDNCFDNSFALHSSMQIVKEYITHEEINTSNKQNKQLSNASQKRKSLTDITICRSQYLTQPVHINRSLKAWGLPLEISKKYEERGISEMFEWQVSCLSNSKVLLDCCNLVYSAPTSAGKTLVAEILTIKTVLERQKKVIIILPFVSIVREKMFYLQDILSSSGVRVEGFMGAQSPPGGLQSVHVAICTIEKANSLINKLLDEGTISELGAVIVDELHLLGDPHRGYLLELLLTKVNYVTSRFEEVTIQLVGMSATLPNLEVLAKWLSAELFITQFRPIPLEEYCLVEKKYYDKQGMIVTMPEDKLVQSMIFDKDNILKICFETIRSGCSVLIFCMTKNRCESLAQNISSSFFKLGCAGNEVGSVLREQLKTEHISEVLEQLKSCPVGLDQVLKNTISFGVAYHHAGLTFDERDIVEGAFKSGAIRVLVATSTLSSGVNLPARKVIIRTPIFQRQPIDILTYKQMIGRAGRMGKDTKGESILICTEAEKKVGLNLMMGVLKSVRSCIESEDKFMRAVLEMIASEVACTVEELELYSQCTLLFTQDDVSTSQKSLLENTLKELSNYELIRRQVNEDVSKYAATSLGKACLSSSMTPNDGLSLFCELQKARQCLVLETDLHLIYLVTPYSVSSQWGDLDWLHLLTLWESLTKAMKRVGELVGVQESFIIRCVRGANKMTNIQSKLSIHKRFYTALALQDLVNEVPLSDVANKFRCARGFLQSLQQSAATFAGMVTVFCHQLGWKNMEMLISQFQDRLHFGIHSELLELMKLPSLNGLRARSIYDAGFETVASVASADVYVIENTLLKAVPFQSEKIREDDDCVELRKRNKIKNIWITGYCGVTTREAAENLIKEARRYVECELGVNDIKWEKLDNDKKVESSHENLEHQEHNNNENETENVIKYDNIIQQKDDEEIKSENSNVQEIIVNASGCATIVKDNDNHENSDSEIREINEPLIEVQHIESAHTLRDSSPIPQSATTKLSGTDDIIWDSLNLTESAFNNVTKFRQSQKFFSPDISFSDTEIKEEPNENEISVKSSSTNKTKDISLFSSDGENSSLFEDSLPLDQIPSKLLDDKNNTNETFSCKQDDTLDVFTVNTNSILDAFQTTLENLDEDEDIKLIYEDEKLSNTPEVRTKIDTLNINNQNPSKRSIEIDINNDEPMKKRLKINLNNNPISKDLLKIHNDNSKLRTVNVNNRVLYCYILRDSDISINSQLICSIKLASLYVVVGQSIKPSLKELIGRKILNQTATNSSKLQNDENTDTNLLLIYSGYDFIVCVDLTNIDKMPDILCKFRDWITDNNSKFKLHSTKYMFLQMKKILGVELSSNCFDVSLADWLMNSHEKEPSVTVLAQKYCNIDLKRKANKDLILEACVKTWALWGIAEEQKKLMLAQNEENFNLLDLEINVSKILGRCEYYGLTVDKDLTSQLLIDVKSSQEIIQKKAYSICGHRFNFNSSKDVAKVLGLYRGRKVSTKKSVLTSHNSQISSAIIFWRKLNSILTKTLFPLTEKAVIYTEDNRVKPVYTMFTCTGRMSMHEPNLQNMPRTFSIPISFLSQAVNDENSEDVIEYNCRNIFKASEGFVLVSADYCQLEMRILTHYCEDVGLTQIMSSDGDVFKSIAASWSAVPEAEVDDDLRQKAKQLCYGIIYGMGNKTLGQSLDVSEMEAAVFMDTFHRTYPKIKAFTSSVIEGCRRKGYVETLMKRRRYLADINSRILGVKNSAERQAVNTMIQGSAADIAKAAMCAVEQRVKHLQESRKPRLILQMHDELIYEVHQTLDKYFVSTLKDVMENTVRLKVPLPVKVKTGAAWGTLAELKL